MTLLSLVDTADCSTGNRQPVVHEAIARWSPGYGQIAAGFGA